jgi:putative transcriptional regulator
MSSLAGTLLVARPPLRDSFFTRSVVLLLQHGPDGAFGLVLNHPAEAEGVPFPVFVGGPCKLEGLLMIHGEEDWLNDDESPSQVCPGVFLGDSACFARVNDEDGDSNPDWKYRVFAGYSGWGPKQLESELNQGAWIVVPAHGEVIFATPIEELWQRLAPQLAPQPSMN